LSALNFLAVTGIASDQPAAQLYDAMIATENKRLDKTGLADVFRRALR
jgi:hypothetical protein